MIENWLSKFKTAWVEEDIDSVLALFTDNVEYWETPYKKLASKDDLRKEWLAINNQSDIKLDTEIFSSDGNRHTVKWSLSYKNTENIEQNWAGTYLVHLNTDGLCEYFHQTGESY